MRRMPIPGRRPKPPLTPGGCPPGVSRGISTDFSGLSPCRGQVAYVLLTRAPVAGRRPKPPPLPLDLHVLGLSLAFILSQDQTLRCRLSRFFFFSLEKARQLKNCDCLPKAAPRPCGLGTRPRMSVLMLYAPELTRSIVLIALVLSLSRLQLFQCARLFRRKASAKLPLFQIPRKYFCNFFRKKFHHFSQDFDLQAEKITHPTTATGQNGQ